MTAKDTTASSQDLAEFEEHFLQDTSTLALLLPTGKPMLHKGLAVSVELFGPSTEQYSKAQAVLNKEASKRAIVLMGSAGDADPEADASQAEMDADVRFLVAVTSRFINFPYPGGAEAVYRQKRLLYVANQVRGHLGKLGNFYKGGSAT